MVDYEGLVQKYFEGKNVGLTLKEVAKRLNVPYEYMDDLATSLYKLELKGYLYKLDDSYFRSPKLCVYKTGMIEKSGKGNYYISLPKGDKVIFDLEEINKNNLHEGDVIHFTMTQDSKFKHKFSGSCFSKIEKDNTYCTNFLAKGIVQNNKSDDCYFVLVNDVRYNLSYEKLGSAYVGDLVTVECERTPKCNTCSVKQVLNRKNREHVFKVIQKMDEKTLVPLNTCDAKFNYLFDLSSFSEGDLILLDVDELNNCKLVKKIENDNTLYGRIKLIAMDYGFPVDFNESVIEECKNMKCITDSDYEERKDHDFRNLITFTIDPKTCKDMDDAISIERIDNGYRLYVHIADVSHYVKPGTKTFAEAGKRTTSRYPANYCIPMLPTILSNDICSLNEGVDRLTKTVIMDIDYNGNVINYNIVNSIINSNYKMTYQNVNETIDDIKSHPDYEPYIESLNILEELSDILDINRAKRGNIRLTSIENEFEFNNDDSVKNVSRDNHGVSGTIIENCMLLANEFVALTALNFDLPFVYRIHLKPDLSKLENLRLELKQAHKFIHSLERADNPRTFQKIYNSIIKGLSSEEVIYVSRLFLHAMTSARYDVKNQGHFALALEQYATFTSPIRRFPDLLNHIMIDAYIKGDVESMNNLFDAYAEYSEACSIGEKDTNNFENTIDNMLLKDYIDSLNDEIESKVDFIVDDRVYVKNDLGLFGYFIANKKELEELRKGTTVMLKAQQLDESTSEVVYEKNSVKKLKKEKRK
jgi:VacB/RNase II family 3'-5' exoribonuclease